uniref:DUF2116 family Zn-ribbon domain-containing protein n=1 Tax=Panagrellus redivivus TaxID=6233 RepID=A0A7E4V0K1_PANRE
MPTSPSPTAVPTIGCHRPGPEAHQHNMPQGGQFCHSCSTFIKLWCRSAVRYEFCVRHRHCAYLHPRCECSDPACWKDHPHNYKICAECRQNMRAMARKKHGRLRALFDDDAHVVALLEAASPAVRNKLIKAGELKMFADIGNSVRKLA